MEVYIMKLSKLLSTATAGILAVSIMTVSASADSVTKISISFQPVAWVRYLCFFRTN